MVVLGRRGGAALVAAVCGLAVGAAASGCSSDGAAADDQARGERAGPRALKAVRGSADALAEAGSAKVCTSVETESGGTRVAIRGRGAYDFEAGTGRLRLALPEPGSGRQSITELLAPGALYIKNRGAGVPPDKWVRVDTAGLVDGNLVTGGATDPLLAAELLRGARGLTYAGRERTRDGVAVRHYRGRLGLADAARAASKPSRPALAAAARGFASDSVAFDVYLDGRGRPRKVRQSFSFANGDGRAAEVTSVTELYDFGARAAIRLPGGGDIYTGKVRPSGGGG